MYIAHMSKDGLEQSLTDHLEAVSEGCASHASKIGLFQIGRLIGLLHDMGKASVSFQSYIRYSYAHPDDSSLRGSITHSTQQ